MVNPLSQGTIIIKGTPDDVFNFLNSSAGVEGVPDGRELPEALISADAFLPIPDVIKGRYYCQSCGRPPIFDSERHTCPSCGKQLVSAGLDWAEQNWGTSTGLLSVRKIEAPLHGNRATYDFECDKIPQKLFIAISKVYPSLMFILRFRERLGNTDKFLERELKIQAGRTLQASILRSPY